MMPVWITYAALCLLCFGLWGFFSKLALDRIPADATLVFQTVGILIVTLFLLKPLMSKSSVSLTGSLYAVLTGMAFTVGSILFFLATKQQGKVSVVVTMTSLYPLITILLSCLFLQEALNLRQAAGMGMAIIAMVLLVSQ